MELLLPVNYVQQPSPIKSVVLTGLQSNSQTKASLKQSRTIKHKIKDYNMVLPLILSSVVVKTNFCAFGMSKSKKKVVFSDFFLTQSTKITIRN